MPEMVYEGGTAPLTPSSSDPEIVELGVVDSPDMIALTALTKPGPFHKRTHELGDYLGIRREGKLVAMAGERLKVPGYTEVSAICTHPEYTGHGYARILTIAVVEQFVAAGKRRSCMLGKITRGRSSCIRGWGLNNGCSCTSQCFGKSDFLGHLGVSYAS